MRRYGIFGLVAIILTLAVAAWAVDPWKGKPVDQWDANDVNKILSDSPWVKRVQIEAKWVKDSGSTAPAASPNGNQPAGPPQATFIVRWNSARTSRYALYRQALLQNEIKQDEYNKAMADVPDDYEILIAGTDMTPFQTATESSLQSQGYLMDKKTKQKIPAKSVTIQKDPADGKVSVVVFTFFKKSQNGQETIPEDQKNIDFYLDSPVKLHETFDLSKMVDSKGRDL